MTDLHSVSKVIKTDWVREVIRTSTGQTAVCHVVAGGLSSAVIRTATSPCRRRHRGWPDSTAIKLCLIRLLGQNRHFLFTQHTHRHSGTSVYSIQYILFHVSFFIVFCVFIVFLFCYLAFVAFVCCYTTRSIISTVHHHVHAPSWSVAVSTRCFQCSRSWAYFHAELRPKLWGWRSASRARSQVWRLTRTSGRTHSILGQPSDWHIECCGDVKWCIHPCNVSNASDYWTNRLYRTPNPSPLAC